MGPIPQSQLSIHFDFGSHGSAQDAESLRRCIARVKPGLLVLENAFTSAEDRKATITEANSKLAEARRSDLGRDLFIEEVTRNAGIFEWPDFTRAVFGIVLSTPGLRIHFVEESPAEQAAGDLFTFPFMMNGPGWALLALSEGDLPEALCRAEKSFREMNDFLIVERNRRVVEGFLRLGGELGELHPLMESRKVSVLARYGALHAGVAQALRSEGFPVDSVRVSELDFSGSLAVRYSTDTAMALTRDDILGILFDYAYGTVFDHIAPDQDGEARRSRALLSSLGGPEGFASLAVSLSSQCHEKDAFISSLRREFEARQKDIYSSPAL